MLQMHICGCTPDANVETLWLFFHWQKIMVCHFYPPCNRSARKFCLYVIAVIAFLKILSSIALQTLNWSHKLHIHLFMKNVFRPLCVCNKRHTDVVWGRAKITFALILIGTKFYYCLMLNIIRPNVRDLDLLNWQLTYSSQMFLHLFNHGCLFIF